MKIQWDDKCASETVKCFRNAKQYARKSLSFKVRPISISQAYLGSKMDDVKGARASIYLELTVE